MSKAIDQKQSAAHPTKAIALSVEPRVTIDSEVTRRIRLHARAHLKTEVCGVLIGESTDEAIEIRASIEALNAAQAGTHVTFTQDAWEEIYKVKDEQYPDARIVGWYHSHPGFGIFLSDHDLFIQENFFSSPGQVAWVYDPHSDDEGCFGWVGGKVSRLTSVGTLYKSGEPVEHAANNHSMAGSADDEDESELAVRNSAKGKTATWVRWFQAALTHSMVLLAGFALAYFLFPRLLAIVPSPATNDVMVVDYNELRSFLKGSGPMPKAIDVMSLPGRSTGPTGVSPMATPASPLEAPPTTPKTTEPASQSATKAGADKSGGKK